MSSKRSATRADLVRMRRAKEYEEQLKRAAQIKARPAATPPIAKRVKQSEVKPVRKPVPSNKRRFNIALNMPRPSVRSIHISRPRFSWRMVSFLLAVMFGTAIYFAFTRPELRVNEARLYGGQMITQAEINSVLNVTGQPVFLLTPSDLETRLRLNFPELATVQVEIALPNIVVVIVTERQPIIRWEQGGGFTWIAEDGIAIRPRGELVGLIPVVALSAPPVEGGSGDPLIPSSFISSDMVHALRALVTRVPQGTPILYETGNGFGWNDPRGWRVYFGTTSKDVELKMRVYESLVASLTNRGIRPALVNVVQPTAPFYRMSQ